jgi:hypothetical protein
VYPLDALRLTKPASLLAYSKAQNMLKAALLWRTAQLGGRAGAPALHLLRRLGLLLLSHTATLLQRKAHLQECAAAVKKE